MKKQKKTKVLNLIALNVYNSYVIQIIKTIQHR